MANKKQPTAETPTEQVEQQPTAETPKKKTPAYEFSDTDTVKIISNGVEYNMKGLQAKILLSKGIAKLI